MACRTRVCFRRAANMILGSFFIFEMLAIPIDAIISGKGLASAPFLYKVGT